MVDGTRGQPVNQQASGSLLNTVYMAGSTALVNEVTDSLDVCQLSQSKAIDYMANIAFTATVIASGAGSATSASSPAAAPAAPLPASGGCCWGWAEPAQLPQHTTHLLSVRASHLLYDMLLSFVKIACHKSMRHTSYILQTTRSCNVRRNMGKTSLTGHLVHFRGQFFRKWPLIDAARPFCRLSTAPSFMMIARSTTKTSTHMSTRLVEVVLWPNTCRHR
jgi:hypothetical protein